MMKDGMHGSYYEIGVFANIFCTTIYVYEQEDLGSSRKKKTFVKQEQ